MAGTRQPGAAGAWFARVGNTGLEIIELCGRPGWVGIIR